MINIFDMFVLLVLVFSGYFGFQTGIISSFFYISSGFFGLWAAQNYSEGPGLKFYVIFSAGSGLIILLGFAAKQIFKKIFLGNVDRMVGGVLGLLLGLAIVGTIVLPVSHHFSEKKRQIVHSSYTGTHIIPVLRKLFPKVKQFRIGDIKEIINLPKLTSGKIDFKISSPEKKK